MITLAPLALALAVAQPQPKPPAEAAPPEVTPPAPAQPAPAAPAPAAPVLTIQDALRIAWERNLDLKALAAQLDEAEEISRKARAGYLPQVALSGAAQLQKRVEVNLGPPIGTVEFQKRYALQGQVQATQVLVSPSLFYGIRTADRNEEATTLTIEDGRRALLYGVAYAYYGAATYKRSVEIAEQLLEIAQRQEKDARVRYQAGTIAKVGLLRAEIDRARAEQDLKRAQNTYDSSKVAVATLLDRAPDFDVAEPPPPPLADQPDAEQLVAAALRARRDLKAARARVAAASAARSAVYGRYFPDVAAFGSYQRQNQAGLTGSEDNWIAGLQLQWQIYDGGLREAEVRESTARIAEADANLRSLEGKARQEVLQALLDLDSARANAAKAREQRDLAAENLRLVDVSFRAGAATPVELADATAQHRNAEINMLTENLNAQLAAVRVLQAVGELELAPRQ
jgi:outer membrane protein, multidrug efflux system